jgi:hypothetical protein
VPEIRSFPRQQPSTVARDHDKINGGRLDRWTAGVEQLARYLELLNRNPLPGRMPRRSASRLGEAREIVSPVG